LRRILAAGFHERSPKRADGIGHTHRAHWHQRDQNQGSDERPAFHDESPAYFCKANGHDPTTKNMSTPLAAVAKNLLVCATSFFESIGEDRQVVEGSVVVNSLRQPNHSAAVPRQPGNLDSYLTQWIANYVRITSACATFFGCAGKFTGLLWPLEIRVLGQPSVQQPLPPQQQEHQQQPRLTSKSHEGILLILLGLNTINKKAEANGPPNGEAIHSRVFCIVGSFLGFGKLFLGSQSIRNTLESLNRVPARFIRQKAPDAAYASASEEPPLPLARLAAQELQHRRWVVTSQPFGFIHGAFSLGR